MKPKVFLSLFLALACLAVFPVSALAHMVIDDIPNVPYGGVTLNPTEFTGPFSIVQCGGPIPETNVNGKPVQIDDHETVYVLRNLGPEGPVWNLYIAGRLSGQCHNPEGIQSNLVCNMPDELRIIEERGPHTTVKTIACLPIRQESAQIFITGRLWPAS